MANIKNSIYLSDDLQKYVDEQAAVFGMGKSAFISMVITLYRQQTEAMKEMSKIHELVEQLKELKEK